MPSDMVGVAVSMRQVHPAVPAMLLTPVCAHTLSFRPLLLPSSSVLVGSVPADSRAASWVSFDGKFRCVRAYLCVRMHLCACVYELRMSACMFL